MVEAKDVTVNVLTSAVTTLVIIFLLIPLLKIPVPAVREIETIETKKYYYPYVMPVELEGDYSTWTVYDSFDDANITADWYNQYAIANKDETILLLLTQKEVAEAYIIATKTLSTITTDFNIPSAIEAEGTIKSILGTYAVALTYVATGIGNGVKIIKNGVLIKTLTYSDLGFNTKTVYSVSISKSGKYIAVSGTRTATGNKGWVVLVGS